MKSIYDELDDRLRASPSVSRRGGPRQDLGLLLFSRRDAIRELWLAAEAAPATPELSAALEKLRPLFGERA
jgi:hypothetical protein